ELLAFVVTDGGVRVVRGLASEREVGEALNGFRFRGDALRHGAARVRAHMDALTSRARRRLASLYRMLLRPLEGLLGSRRLVVVPHRALHYVPFHALDDGESYVVERREVSYAPSAGVLLRCLEKPSRAIESALLLGVADAQTTHVREEIRALAPLFPRATALLDNEATAELMSDFYKQLLAGARPAAALRSAQLSQMRSRPHPFFWSPFILTGRW